ncbi:MAG: CAP domain-containing protein [Candidatus Thiodiazotropha endolucinida]
MEHCIYGLCDSRKSSWRILCIGLSLITGLATPIGSIAAVWSPREAAVFDLVNQQRSINNLPHLIQNEQLHASALGHSQSMADNNFFSHTTLAGSNGTTFVDRIREAGHIGWTYGGENIAGGHGRTSPPAVEMQPLDAARSVMYGTAELDELNAFFFANSQESWISWDDVGMGVSGDGWNAWHNFMRQTTNNQRDGGWMGSHGHRENILSVLFDEIGVGYFWEPGDTIPILGDHGEISFPLHAYWTQDFTGDDLVAPVPLPGAFWLLGCGVIGLLLLDRRRGVE